MRIFLVPYLYVNIKEGNRGGIIEFGRKMAFVESGAFLQETSVAVNKARALKVNILDCQERKGFNVKRPKT